MKNIISGVFSVWAGIFLVMFLVPLFLFATNYYVSPAGADNNSGSPENPFKTIQKGINQLKPGDTLFVRQGTYVETLNAGNSGTSVLPITIMAYPGEVPVIDGEDKLPSANWGDLVLITGNHVHISGFEVKNSNINGIRLGGGGVMLEGEHTKASKMNVHHIWEHGIIAKGNYSMVEDCIVWQCAYSNSINPGNPAAGYWSTGISAARSPVDGITRNAILRGNISYNNWGEGISSFEADGTLIEDNISFDNWSVNLYVSDTRNALVQRNIVYNTPNNVVKQRRPFTLGDELANKPRSANNIVINNLIYNADIWAFWSTGVPGSGLDNVIIAHNTIVNGQLEIGASVEDQAYNKSALICNNIFMNENGNPWEIMGSLANLTFSNNLWSAQPPSGLRCNGDVIGDPQIEKTGSTGFGELAGAYFKLTSSSPAINKGIVLEQVTSDFFKSPRDSQPDLGAHEYIPPTGIFQKQATEKKPVITLNYPQLIISQAEESAYKNMVIYSSAGVPVISREITQLNFSLNISDLAAGIYIVVFNDENRRAEIRLSIP